VNRSDWRWRLEGEQGLRAGLLQVKGLGLEAGQAIEEARRAAGVFRSVQDFCDRLALERSKLERLADAGAFECFGLGRREALWEVTGWRRRLPLEAPPRQVVLPGFPALSDAEISLLDHAAAGFSPRRHPLSHVREALRARGFLSSTELVEARSGDRVRAAGLVITRQRPQTARGTFFITLEDEEGFTNLIVHAPLFERHERLLRRVRFLGCTGLLQAADGVVNLVADRFEDLARERLLASSSGSPSGVLGGLKSRDFL